MTDKILEEIRDELTAIRLLLAAKPATVSTAPARAQYAASSGGDSDEPVPQPTELVSDPGAATIHFGKNSGKRIDELIERSLGWYTKDPEPRLDKDGKPFPPRAQDVTLRNACRQLWHSRRGTLAGVAPVKAAPTAQAAQADTQDEVPF